MELETFKLLVAFVDRAERAGKYQTGTAAGFKAALRAVKESWKAGEPDEPAYLEQELEAILHRQVDRGEHSGHTVKTYLQRARRVLSDWKVYGRDAKAFLAWRPKTRARRSDAGSGARLRTLVWSLRADRQIQIQLPRDFDAEDNRRLKKLLDLEVEVREGNGA